MSSTSPVPTLLDGTQIDSILFARCGPHRHIYVSSPVIFQRENEGLSTSPFIGALY
jgi:hypothetical protein